MLVLIRGAGDLATGIALRLFRSHLRVAMTDLPQPTAIRRTVCFSQAILYGSYQVEDVTAERAETEDDVRRILSAGQIPVLADPRAVCRAWLRPDVVVDAILAKKNLGTAITDAPLVIGVGPGFCAGKDCHAVIETMRGHTLGRVIRGMLADGTPVYKGMKSGDVDPRGELSYCYTASDKAIAIGGGVLQAILEYTGVLSNVTGQNAWEV